MRAHIHDGQEHCKRSAHRPDTLVQDQTSPLRGFPLQHTAGPYIRISLRLLRGSANDGEIGPCVDGSRLSRGYRTGAASVGAAMCSAYSCGSHKAAGHNAFRGSGPGQQLAFDNAVAQVGCPDRRVDQSCITCCLPFPTVPTAPSPALFHSPPQQAISRARLAPCNSRPWPSGPKPSWRACWRARSPRP